MNEEIVFEWNETKNRKNILKHGISFEQAILVFQDEYAVLFDDPDHSQDEDRFLIIGMCGVKDVCIVSHCYRQNDSVIRLISARQATGKERTIYESYRK